MVENLPAKQEIQAPSLDGEGPLEKKMATQSCIPAWENPQTEEPGGVYSLWGHKESDTRLGN